MTIALDHDSGFGDNHQVTPDRPDLCLVTSTARKPCHVCGGPLTGRRRSYCSDSCRRITRRLDRKQNGRDIRETRGAIVRHLHAYARHVAEGDVAELPELVVLRDELELQIEHAVAGLRSADGGAFSWAQLGEVLGISRQAVQKQYGHVGGARQPGGQPAGLR